MKKLIPALALLVVSAILMGTSTFAWFAMNSEVTVTGMKVHTQVSDNLFIAPSTTAATTKAEESAFKTAVDQNLYALLEPVSTVNGVSFFYTATSNVEVNGDATNNVYTAYTESTAISDTGAGKTQYDAAFQTNYSISTPITTANVAYGFVDYAFQIKAVNTDTSAAKDLKVTALTLTYGGTTQAQKAFRVAVFVDDMGEAGTTAAKTPETSSPLKSILTPSGATNFTSGEAVSSTSATAAVTYGTALTLAAVPKGKTNYYKVVVRMWLEGEDSTCTASTFASLTDDWALDVTIKLGTDDPAVTAIAQTQTAEKISFTTTETASTAKTVAGTTYYQIGSKSYYTTHSGALETSDRIFTITSDKYVTDITNQCSITAA